MSKKGGWDVNSIFRTVHVQANLMGKINSTDRQYSTTSSDCRKADLEELKYFWMKGKKDMNKAIQMNNGNRTKSSLKIGHWNLGSKLWENKVNPIQHLVDDLSLDLFFISESNIIGQIPDYKTKIDGYTMVHPLTMRNPNLNYSRIVLLVKKGVIITVLNNLMSEEVSTIWIRVNKRGHKRVVVGGGYIGNTA